MLELTNVDFLHEAGVSRLDNLVQSWERSSELQVLLESITLSEANQETFTLDDGLPKGYPRGLGMQTWILFHRMALVSPLWFGLIEEIVS